MEKKIVYLYTPAGTKLKQSNYDENGSLQEEIDYVGNFTSTGSVQVYIRTVH